jgi:hypothetical protein
VVRLRLEGSPEVLEKDTGTPRPLEDPAALPGSGETHCSFTENDNFFLNVYIEMLLNKFSGILRIKF